MLQSLPMPNALLVFMASLLSTLHGSDRPARGTSEPLMPFVADVAPQHDGHDDGLSAPTWPITFFFENRKEALALSFFDLGSALAISREAVSALSHHVRCFRTDRERPMHPRLIEIVARVSEAFGRETVSVVSGFRAPPFGAPHSKHFHGRAMDLRLPGVSSKKIAAWVWKNFRGVGVGQYPKQDFVHIDVRDVDVRWVDTSEHGESAHARYSGRPPSELLPEHAPRLAYDIPPRFAAPASLTSAATSTVANAVALLMGMPIATPPVGFRGLE